MGKGFEETLHQRDVDGKQERKKTIPTLIIAQCLPD